DLVTGVQTCALPICRPGPDECPGDGRCCLGGDVIERTPVDELTQPPDRSGPVPAVRLRARTAPSLRVYGHFVRVLSELPTRPARSEERRVGTECGRG